MLIIVLPNSFLLMIYGILISFFGAINIVSEG